MKSRPEISILDDPGLYASFAVVFSLLIVYDLAVVTLEVRVYTVL
jgi:hypothetical protein